MPTRVERPASRCSSSTLLPAADPRAPPLLSFPPVGRHALPPPLQRYRRPPSPLPPTRRPACTADPLPLAPAPLPPLPAGPRAPPLRPPLRSARRRSAVRTRKSGEEEEGEPHSSPSLPPVGRRALPLFSRRRYTRRRWRGHRRSTRPSALPAAAAGGAASLARSPSFRPPLHSARCRHSVERTTESGEEEGEPTEERMTCGATWGPPF